MAPNDPKQAAASGGGGFFASIASSLSNFGSAMSKSVNGYEPLESEFLKLINFFVLMVIFYNSFIWVSPDNEFTLFENFNTARCKRSLLWKIIFLNWSFIIGLLIIMISLLCFSLWMFHTYDAWDDVRDSWLFLTYSNQVQNCAFSVSP